MHTYIGLYTGRLNKIKYNEDSTLIKHRYMYPVRRNLLTSICYSVYFKDIDKNVSTYSSSDLQKNKILGIFTYEIAAADV